MAKGQKLGALWVREQRGGGTYMTGEVEIDGVKRRIVVFPNGYRTDANRQPNLWYLPFSFWILTDPPCRTNTSVDRLLASAYNLRILDDPFPKSLFRNLCTTSYKETQQSSAERPQAAPGEPSPGPENWR